MSSATMVLFINNAPVRVLEDLNLVSVVLADCVSFWSFALADEPLAAGEFSSIKLYPP